MTENLELEQSQGEIRETDNARDVHSATIRGRIADFVNHSLFQNAIITLIIINAVILGVECIPSLRDALPVNLQMIDKIILGIFVAEILLRFVAMGWSMARDPWSIFDVFVVGISMLAVNSGISAFRAFRVFRILRLISAFPKMRLVVSALLDSIPGIASVGFLLVLILFVSSVMATNMFGTQFPVLFGDLFTTMFTLFQILTLEGWAEIANEVMVVYPYAWIFFVSFILVATFTLLNLFVAIVVSVLEHEEIDEETQKLMDDHAALHEDVRLLTLEIRRLADKMGVGKQGGE